VTQTALAEQLAKLNPNSGAAQLYSRVSAEREAERAQKVEASGGSLSAETAAKDAETARLRAEQAGLEAKHGKLATAATQAGRGVLDALLAPGALVGMAAESTGAAFGSEGLEQFGRDLGQASSGSSAIEAAAFLFGGGGKHGLTTAERVSQTVSEQQKAWPTLSAVSHMGGMVVPMLAGGLASSGTKASQMVAVSGLEGAAGGAQVAYEKNEALRDVLSSALVGGALGVGAAGIGEGLSGLARSKPLRAAARELTEDANLAAAGVKRSGLTELVGAEAAAAETKATELAGALSSYRFQSGPLEGKPLVRMFRTPEGIQNGVRFAEAETTDALSAARQEIATRAAKSVEHAPFAEALAQAGADKADDVAESALVAMSGDVAEFQTLRSRAKAFQELGSLISNAKAPAKSSVDTIAGSLGQAVSIGQMVMGSNPLVAIAQGVLSNVARKVVQQRSASTVAALANTLVLDTVSSALGRVMPAIEMAGGAASGRAAASDEKPPARPKPLTPERQQERYRERLDLVTKAITQANPEDRAELIGKIGDMPPALVMSASADMAVRLQQLHSDMPKPQPNLRGQAFETMSNQQVRLANAMFEATTDPMSVFTDFAAGDIDYDKVSYAWKQYPGLKQAAQAGLMDMLQVQLTEERRSTIPDSMLSQLDNLFGFEGELQPTLNRQFASRIEQLAQAAQGPDNPPPRPGGKLQLPSTQPTFTQRLSGQRG
jgi:hypothetical protein